MTQIGADPRESWRFAFSSMGCPCAIQIEGLDRPSAERISALARAEVDRLDRKYSHYRDNSLIAEFERRAGERIAVDAETANLLDFAATLFEQSAGLFDLTAGPLTRLWDARLARVPHADEIARALAQVGWQHLDWQRPWLRLARPGMHLDLGGMVKEYAADRAAQICRDAGASHGVVDLGGDLAIIGAHIDGSAWQVGIKDPQAPARARAQIAVHAGGLATSGDYERALVVDGRRYSHILDPRSGWPIESFASVSVCAPSCLVAGAASTLAMLLGPAAGLAYLEELGLVYLCVGQDGGLHHRQLQSPDANGC